jgi:hypothetical protein
MAASRLGRGGGAEEAALLRRGHSRHPVHPRPLDIVCGVVLMMLIQAMAWGEAHRSTDIIVLNVAPQDASVFLTWNPVSHDPARSYELFWRLPASTTWQRIQVQGREHYTLTGLANNTEYEFFIRVPGSTIPRSRIARQTPRVRTSCTATRLFCSPQEAERWMLSMGIDPLSLKCRGKEVKGWDLQVPNCIYSTGDSTTFFLLNRAVDSIFTPPMARALKYIPNLARQAIWPEKNPFSHPASFPMEVERMEPANIGKVQKYLLAYSYRIKYHERFSSRITWFIPENPRNVYAIYHEGHGDSGVWAAPQTIDWLLEQGFIVINIDMPLFGANRADRTESLVNHNDLDEFDEGLESPVSILVLPVKFVVDMIYRDFNARKEYYNDLDHYIKIPNILMIGRSGGGWTSTIYGTIDRRITASVSVAGFVPLSLRLPSNISDYEQQLPHLYDVVTYEDFMKASGSIGALYIYNAKDSCCFRVQSTSPLVGYIKESSIQYGKYIDIWIDEENTEHSISERGYEVLGQFLESVGFWQLAANP